MPDNENSRKSFSLEAYRTRLESVRADREARKSEHVLAVQGLSQISLIDRPLNIFSDGDSWFEYPLPFSNPSDVINKLKSLANPKVPFILNLAHHGDEARTALGLEKRKRIIEALQERRFGDFDAILFSGGGDDIAGDQFCLWVDDWQKGMDASQGLDMARLRNALGVVESACLDLIDIRNKFAPQAKIFMHSYDFPIPDGRGVCGAGPWLQPSLIYRGWNSLAEGKTIVKNALLEFNSLLTGIAARHPDDVILVPTQGTLNNPDYKNDWDNELHPTPNGFEKIAGKFLLALREHFPGRI